MVLEYTLDDIDRVAKQLIDSFTHSIVAIIGQMGSGKTTLEPGFYLKNLVFTFGSQRKPKWFTM